MPSLAGRVGALTSLAAAAGIAYAAYRGLAPYSDIRLSATTLVALAGTLTGFLLTALSLLVGIADRPFIENLRMTGHYRVLVHRIFQAAGLWLCVVALGLTAHIVSGSVQRIVVAIAFGATALALLHFLSLGSKFFKVMSLLANH